MKPSSWDKQLGLASPLERAAHQSNQTDNPSKNVVGAGCQSPDPRPPEGRGEVYLLTSSFIGRVTKSPMHSASKSAQQVHGEQSVRRSTTLIAAVALRFRQENLAGKRRRCAQPS